MRPGQPVGYGKVVDSDELVLHAENFTLDHYAPHRRLGWSDQSGGVRSWSRDNTLVPKLLFNNAELPRDSDGNRQAPYLLKIKYNKEASIDNPFDAANKEYTTEAAIVIGRIEFNSDGKGYAEGADWERLLSDQRQIQLPYSHGARGLPIWRAHKLSEPWKDDDGLTFKVDVERNTIVYKKTGAPQITLWNVLQFTNNPTSPETVSALAFYGYGEVQRGGGGGDSELTNHKFTII